MDTPTKSMRLRGKPNKEKAEALRRVQTDYTNASNAFIGLLWDEPALWADIFRCKPSTALLRAFEKEHRAESLGSAMSQTAADEAVEKLSLVFQNARMVMLREVMADEDEHLFIRSIALFTACLEGSGYEKTHALMQELYDKAEKKKDADKQSFYKQCLDKMEAIGAEKVEAVMESVRLWFAHVKNDMNIPHVGRAWVRADSRAQTFGKSKEIAAPYVLSATTEVGGKRTEVPLVTSPDSLRRLEQYDRASTLMYSMKPNGVLLVNVAVKKKVKNRTKKGEYVGADVGITDVISTSDGKFYGSLLPAQAFYDTEVLFHLGRLQALRNLMKTTRIAMRQETDLIAKDVLRRKICNINTMIQQNKVVGRSLNRYEGMVDREIAAVVRAFGEARLADGAITVLEALDIRNFDRGKKANRRDSMWARGKLNKRLEEWLAWHGLDFVEVEPSYTSQICPVCGHLERGNRDGKKFKCLHCGHEDDADHNASLNIRERAVDNGLKKMLAKPATLRERQAALRKRYAAKEAEYDKRTVSSA